MKWIPRLHGPHGYERITGTSLKILARIMDGPPPTIYELMELTGAKSENATYGHLERLRRLGLVMPANRTHCTISPAVEFIPVEQLFTD